MKCPSCASALPVSAPQCPQCKLTLHRLDVKFGKVPLHSSYITDRSERLPLRKITKLRQALERFEKRFPQSLFSVFVVELPQGTAVAEYAFWLANRANFTPLEIHPENFNLLLVIDLTSRSAALTVGYGLEAYLSIDDLSDALDPFSNIGEAADLTAAIHACIERAMNRMREIAKALRSQSVTEKSGKTAEAY